MKVNKDQEGIMMPIYGEMEISSKYVRMYDDATYALATVHGCTRLLIEYMSKIMDTDNIVHISNVTKMNFLKDIEEKTGMTYSMISVDKSVSKLKELKVILNIQKGVVQVNPRYFFKGESNYRRERMITERIIKQIDDINK